MTNSAGTEGAAAATASVALIVGLSEEARDVALFAAARGVRVVLVGETERTIAERVGEIVFGGGKARHFAGDPSANATLVAALEKASASFGAPVTHAFVDGAHASEWTRALAGLAPSVRVVVLTRSGDASILVSKIFETS